MVSEIPVQYDALLERLSEETLDRLQDEPAPNTRVLLFGFPAQMARLKQTIYDFLNQIFEPTRYHANAALRGFYFTSGTQQGTPIDQLIGALVKNFGAEEVSGVSYSGPGQELFPSRSDPEGHHRRGGLGLDRSCRRAPRDDHQGGGAFGDRARRARRVGGLAHQLSAQQHPDRANRARRQELCRGRRPLCARDADRRPRSAQGAAAPARASAHADRLCGARRADATDGRVRPQPARSAAVSLRDRTITSRSSGCSARA